MSACEAPGTTTTEPLVSRTSAAPAFQFDVMPKITTATPDATATRTSALVRAATTVKIENKWPAAEVAAFSYQRAAKQIGATTAATTAAAPTRPSQSLETGIDEIPLPPPISIPITPPIPLTGDNPCEQLRPSNLALRKAQLKAAFFGSKQPERAAVQAAVQTTYRRTSARTEARKPVQQLIDQYQAMIVQQQQDQQQMQQQQQQQHLSEPKSMPGATASNSDEGCNVTGSGLSPYSSDGEDMAINSSSSGKLSPRQRKLKVTRCASSDSALGLEVDDASMDVCAPSVPLQRRMTLTVTDLPLRPALLPLAEPTALPDSPLTSPTGSAVALGALGAHGSIGVPTKVLLEERVVAAPGSRRESTQSSYSELGSGFPLGVRYVRTPSVVVSDYSDDITACGISMEEMEYFRLQRARGQRRCSLEAGHGGHGHGAGGTGSGAGGMSPGCAKDEGQSDVSAASSCSNLYYCGSTISALDGGECIVNGVRVALARKSSTQSSSLSGEEEEEEEEDDEEEHELELEYGRGDRDRERERESERERERERERQLSELLAATQLGERQIRDRSKKVGARDDVTNQGNLKLD